jgi:steroid 5-alpha reductase family enzyme
MGGPIRIIFSVCTLLLLGMLVFRVQAGVWTPLNWAMLTLSGFCCLLVFVSFVYVFNYSYGLCSIGNAVLINVYQPSALSLVLGAIMVFYGARLILFTRKRYGDSAYAANVGMQKEASDKIPLAVKIMLWLQMSMLMVFHQFALLFVSGASGVEGFVVAGAAIMLAGVVIETVADRQKQAAKKTNPDSFIVTGLFARWRHPNYLGEIMLHIGLIVVGVGVVSGSWDNYVAVLLSPFYIILLMMSEARTKDSAQLKSYGDRDEYRAYLQRSGSLLPKF